MRVLKLIQDATIRERGENMLNYWWVTRPKRKLNSVPEVLAAFADMSLNQEWEGQRDSHLAYEDALETAGLKRKENVEIKPMVGQEHIKHGLSA